MDFQPTPEAALSLGVSIQTLRRWCRQGRLEEGTHWKSGGPFTNSPRLFDVDEVRRLIENPRQSLGDVRQ